MKDTNKKEMTKRYCRKMAAVFLTGMLAITTAATGCGKKTVDYDVDGNGGSSGGNADSGSLQGKYGIPEEIDTEIAVGDSGIQKIAIEDDEITVPDAGDMYIQKEKKKEAASDTRKEIAEAVFEKDKGIYAYDYEKQTKEDIQKQIDSYEEEKASDAQYNEGMNASYYEEEISNLKEQLATALDEYPAAGDYSSESYIGTIGDYEFTLSTPSGDSEDGSSGYYSLYMRDDLITYRPKDGEDGVYFTSIENYNVGMNETEVVDGSSNACSMSEDEARQVAEDFIAKVGGTDVSLQKSSPLCWVYYKNFDGSSDATEVDGYEFVFSKTINGQSISTMNVYNADNLQFTDSYLDIPSEEYTVDVDSNGVICANWTDYMEADGTAEPATLLSFDKLLETANETIPAYYAKYPTNYKKVEFNDMKLSYYLKAGENEGEISYVPVWILSQYEEYTDYTEEDYPSQVVILDATDGSVIDLVDLAKALGSYYSYDDSATEEETDTVESTDEESSDATTDSTDEDASEDASGDSGEETTEATQETE